MAFLISWSLISLLQKLQATKKKLAFIYLRVYDDALNLKPENTYFSTVLLEVLIDG